VTKKDGSDQEGGKPLEREEGPPMTKKKVGGGESQKPIFPDRQEGKKRFGQGPSLRGEKKMREKIRRDPENNWGGRKKKNKQKKKNNERQTRKKPFNGTLKLNNLRNGFMNSLEETNRVLAPFKEKRGEKEDTIIGGN